MPPKAALVRVAVLALAAALVVVGLSSCRFSDTITETIYDSSYEDVDHSATPMIVNTPESDNLREDLPSVSKEKSDVIREEKMALALYSKKNTNSTLPARKPIYDKDAGDNGQTDENPVLAKGSQKDQGKGDADNSSSDPSAGEKGQVKNKAGAGGKGGDGAGGKDGNGKNGKGGSSQDGDKASGKKTGAGGSGGGDKPTNDPTGKKEQLKKVDNGTVICTGEIANAVALVAGPDHIIASSKSFTDNKLNSEKLYREYADEVKRIKTLWSGDGADSSQIVDGWYETLTKQIDTAFETAKEKGKPAPTIVYLSNDTYSPLSSSQEKKLRKYVEETYGDGAYLGSSKNGEGNRVILPEFDSPTDIIALVKALGTVLGSDAQKKADKYIEWHEKLIGDTTSKNGGYAMSKEIETAFDLPDKVFDYNNNTVKAKDYAGNDDLMFTTYVSRWDDTASYKLSLNYFKKPGIGISDLGRSGRPASGYLCAGGVIDNAACVKHQSLYSGKAAHVWPFKNANYIAGYPDEKDGWENLTYKSGLVWHDFATAADYSNNLLIAHDARATNEAGWSGISGLGCRKFPAVVCASQHIAEEFAKHAATDEIYYAWPAILDVSVNTQVTIPYIPAERDEYSMTVYDFDHEVFIGANAVKLPMDGASFKTSTANPKQIKKAGKEPVVDNDYGYYILVNPIGLTCDWANGSIESVLETAWAYDMFKDGNVCKLDKNGYFAKQVKKFYKDFYDYDLSSSDLAAIEAGAEE